jgi:hypothetical protein
MVRAVSFDTKPKVPQVLVRGRGAHAHGVRSLLMVLLTGRAHHRVIEPEIRFFPTCGMSRSNTVS